MGIRIFDREKARDQQIACGKCLGVAAGAVQIDRRNVWCPEVG